MQTSGSSILGCRCHFFPFSHLQTRCVTAFAAREVIRESKKSIYVHFFPLWRADSEFIIAYLSPKSDSPR